MGPQIIFDRLAHAGRRDAVGQMGGDRRENIATVEGLADGCQKILRIRDGADFVFTFGQDEREDPIIRADEELSGGFDQDGAAQGSDARIDHHHVHGPGRKVAISLCDGEGGFGDVEGAAFMRDVNHARLGTDPKNDTLHDPGEMIGETEVGGQSDDGVRSGWRWHLRTILVPAHKNRTTSRFFGKSGIAESSSCARKPGSCPVLVDFPQGAASESKAIFTVGE
jgi:hypothetical protein